MSSHRSRSNAVAAGIAPALVLLIASCTPTAFLNLTVPTSDFAPGMGTPVPRRLQVGFINNTAFRAIFTAGSYDPLDRNTSPTNFAQLRLEGNSSSAQIPIPCRKVLSLGDEELIRLIGINNLTVNDPRALIDGVNFSGAPLGDPLEAAATEGTAQGLTLQAGVDFNCEGLVLLTFEQDAAAPGGFRIDFAFVPDQ
ncbi:MAG: hypothetical protein ACE5F9_05380 [Phycisphaerae bacterium]